jgi:putative selenium metabolism protein SsnA
MNQDNTVIKNGAVYFEDDLIKDIGTTKELEDKYKVNEVLDAKGRVVMPGFICAHMHFYSAFATGMPFTPFPKGFVNVLENLWWKLDKALEKDDVYYSALLGYIQAVRCGTTTVIDHHASPSYITGSLDQIEKAGRELGVRSNLCYEVTNRNGDDEANEGLKENERFLRKCQTSNDDLMSGLVGLHASFTLNDESLQQAGDIVKNYDTGVHIHVAEGKADMDDARENYNSTVIQRLEKFNLLNSKSILAHTIHLEELDYPIIQKYRPNITHQPRSNMNNAVGSLNIWKLNEYGIPFGMGTDGMSADMKAELLNANLIHKHVTADNTVGTFEVYESLFNVNPKIIQNTTGVKTGRLIKDHKADIIISGYYPKSPIHSSNVLGHIMFGVINEPISSTIIDGNVRMQEGEILHINEKEISAKCEELAEGIWGRIQ